MSIFRRKRDLFKDMQTLNDALNTYTENRLKAFNLGAQSEADLYSALIEKTQDILLNLGKNK